MGSIMSKKTTQSEFRFGIFVCTYAKNVFSVLLKNIVAVSYIHHLWFPLQIVDIQTILGLTAINYHWIIFLCSESALPVVY